MIDIRLLKTIVDGINEKQTFGSGTVITTIFALTRFAVVALINVFL